MSGFWKDWSGLSSVYDVNMAIAKFDKLLTGYLRRSLGVCVHAHVHMVGCVRVKPICDFPSDIWTHF